MLRRTVADLRTLYHLTVAPRRGKTPAERLESFYRGQAGSYDAFRERLLPGRRELVSELGLDRHSGGVWIDLGGGTASNLELAAPALPALKRVYVVDLCPSLLAKAQERTRRHGWSNVELVEADATSFVPREGVADVVTFSYSLSMIPDWPAALEHAWRLLRPGGTLGVVDFFVSRKHESAGRTSHGWLTRTLWPIWFAFDDVFLSSEPPHWLARHCPDHRFTDGRARLPYLRFGRVPFYRFVGVKPHPGDA